MSAATDSFVHEYPGGWRWRHMRASKAEEFAKGFVENGASETSADLLSEDEVRAYCGLDHDGDGAVLILRGVNFDPEGEPEDAVALRVYADARGLTTASLRRIRAVERVFYEPVSAYENPFDLLLDLVDALNEGWRASARELETMLDALEDSAVDTGAADLEQLQLVRRRTIGFTRHAKPYAEALLRLGDRERKLLPDAQIGLARSLANNAQRTVDVLTALREHVASVQSHIDSVAAQRERDVADRLTRVATVFLPLNFLAAMLGANVGGIPGSNSVWGFAIMSVAMLALAVGAWVLLRRLD